MPDMQEKSLIPVSLLYQVICQTLLFLPTKNILNLCPSLHNLLPSCSKPPTFPVWTSSSNSFLHGIQKQLYKHKFGLLNSSQSCQLCSGQRIKFSEQTEDSHGLATVAYTLATLHPLLGLQLYPPSFRFTNQPSPILP